MTVQQFLGLEKGEAVVVHYADPATKQEHKTLGAFLKRRCRDRPPYIAFVAVGRMVINVNKAHLELASEALSSADYQKAKEIVEGDLKKYHRKAL